MRTHTLWDGIKSNAIIFESIIKKQMKRFLKKIKEVLFKREEPKLIENIKKSSKLKRTKKQNATLNILIEKHKNDIYRKDGTGYKITTIKKIASAVGLNVDIYVSYETLYINSEIIDFGGFGREKEVAYIYEMCLRIKKDMDMASHLKRLETKRKNLTRKVLVEKIN